MPGNPTTGVWVSPLPGWPNAEMRRMVVLIGVGILLSVCLLLFAPFKRIHPNDPSLEMGTIRAHAWSRPSDPNAIVMLDGLGLALEGGLLWIAIASIEAVLRASERR